MLETRNCDSNPTGKQSYCNHTPRVDEEGGLGLCGLRGMGGVGKTTTAIAVAHSDKVRQVFGADNIWWITVGQETAGMEILVHFARKVSKHAVHVCGQVSLR